MNATIGRLLAVAEFEAEVLEVYDRLEQLRKRSGIAGPTFEAAIERAFQAAWEARLEVDTWKDTES